MGVATAASWTYVMFKLPALISCIDDYDDILMRMMPAHHGIQIFLVNYFGLELFPRTVKIYGTKCLFTISL